MENELHFFEVTHFSEKNSNYLNFWLPEWGLVPIYSDNWSSAVGTQQGGLCPK